jgi:S1-C subfamily serine protease
MKPTTIFRRFALLLIISTCACSAVVFSTFAQEVDPAVRKAETQRIAAIEKVRPSVVAIFGPGGQGGGSGVLIDKDGYALTNFHVVEGAGPVMQCGLPDGALYDATLVGLDKVGDVALIKLLPQKKGKDFPFAAMGDSEKVKAGDWSMAMGNPFLLATDFNPTVTFGLVSGIHRYQYPAGTLLEYTDCIQIDTSINPGNSGGPLFNMDGELIGINGRGSFEKRGRVNSGAGYAISINQIKNFLGHLRAGIDTDHATLGALVESEGEEGGGNKMTVKSIIEDSDARRRGLDTGDELVSFAGRHISTVNQYKNVLGLYPKGWRVPMEYRHENEKREVLVRLMKLQRDQQAEEGTPKPRPRPAPPRPPVPPRKSPASAYFEQKPGFANYYFNKQERDRLLGGFHQHGEFSGLAGDWIVEAQADLKQGKTDFLASIREEQEDLGPNGKPLPGVNTYHLKVESLPPLPDADAKDSQSAYRQAVRKADGLLRQHAKSFPQEVWAEDSDSLLKEHVLEIQKNVATILSSLMEADEELLKAGKEDSKESKLWQANYDYTLARLSGFIAYVHEYNALLGQLRREPPPRDPKLHRGWRMMPQEKPQSGAEAKKFAQDAQQIFDKMIKAYKDTRYAELARRDRDIPLGLKWQATGGTKTMVHATLAGGKFDFDPLKAGQEVNALKQPPGSGGLLMALYLYRRFLVMGASGFEGQFTHGGQEPIYPPPQNGKTPKSLQDLRVDTAVLHTEHAAVNVKWYFSLQDQTLLGFEVWVDPEADPCEVYLSDYRTAEGRLLPHRIDVQYGNDRFGTFLVKRYQLSAIK